jgi:hypothetical protein
MARPCVRMLLKANSSNYSIPTIGRPDGTVIAVTV